MAKEGRSRHKDDVAVELLVKTGMARNVARALVFLSTRSEATSLEIEKATGLRQPEVSIATLELRNRRWVEKRDLKKEGKGRPVHAYRLIVPFDTIIETVARQERRRIEEIRMNIRRLKRGRG